MTPPRTLHLIERHTRLCRLAPVEVDFLLAHHRASLEVLPTAERHIYRITPGGVSGVLITPRRRIVISSKVPLANLFLLLDPLADLPFQRDQVQPTNGSEIIDLLAGQFAAKMLERAAAGLHRAYRETANHGAYLVGQIDVPAQLRQPICRKEQIHSRQDEFTLDIPCNQVPRTVAANLLASGLLAPVVRERLLGALSLFGEVSEANLTPDVLDSLQRERLPAEYVPLIDLCRLLIDSLAPTPIGGAFPAPAFLLPLERLFEQYLTRAVQDGFPDAEHTVSAQESFFTGESAPGQPPVRIRPDVTLYREGRAVLVIDAKWKQLSPTALIPEDLYQMLAYCAVLGTSTAVLVHPGGRAWVWDYDFPHAGAWVQVRTLRVSGTREQCLRSRRRLARDLRRMADGRSRHLPEQSG
jgi:5-methylcytosine-specific restriction enzyme subunit McrC